MSATWMIRAGKAGVFVDTFLEQKEASVDFWTAEMGPLPAGVSKQYIIDKLTPLRAHDKPNAIAGSASQLYRFLSEIQSGDRVVTGDPSRRRYLVGTVLSAPSFEKTRYSRDVKWTHRVARDALSVDSRNTLGAIQTLFRLNEDVVADIDAHKQPIDAPATDAEPIPTAPQLTEESRSIDDLMSEADAKAKEFIEDRIARLDPYAMQSLVAGILRAMGYKTRESAPGADRGVDIFASPDGLGLQEPRVFVEVKHRRNTQMSAPELRSFLGGRKPGDRCLYVSTGGFTKEARYEADRSTIPLTLLDLPALRELLVDHYEKLDTETRQLIPLRRLYGPVGED